MRRALIFISMVFLASFSYAEAPELTKVVNIGLFDNDRPTQVFIQPAFGDYEVIAGNKTIATLTWADGLQLTLQGGRIYANLLSTELGTFDRLRIQRKKWGSSIKVNKLAPGNETKVIPDNVIVRVVGQRLQVLNNVYLEHYIAGVVESESGSKQSLEYYKVQAIIARTYALANLRRHQAGGFDLCDQVHCQAFKHRALNDTTIVRATIDTRGIVVVDHKINLITASYHSNCGGHTVNSEDAFKYPLSYLKGVPDTFCQSMPHAKWEKLVSVEHWQDYLLKHNLDSSLLDSALQLRMPERTYYLMQEDSVVILKNLRPHFGINSTWFNVQPQDSTTLLLSGQGYGHGVGLCQEGAMARVNSGFSYSDVLHYYYERVHLINLSALDFFREQ